MTAIIRPNNRLEPIRERVAVALGWTVEDTKTLSWQSLRDLVRPLAPQLASELDKVVAWGGILL